MCSLKICSTWWFYFLPDGPPLPRIYANEFRLASSSQHVLSIKICNLAVCQLPHSWRTQTTSLLGFFSSGNRSVSLTVKLSGPVSLTSGQQKGNIAVSTISSLTTGSLSSIDHFGFNRPARCPSRNHTQWYAACFFSPPLYTNSWPTLSSHPSIKTIFFWVFLHTTGISYEDDCFALIACGCNKHLPNASRTQFVHETENESEREISQEPEKTATAMDRNIPSITSCSLHPACTACNSRRLDLYKPVTMRLGGGCTSVYIST